MAAQPVDEALTKVSPPATPGRRAPRRAKPPPMDPRRAPAGVAAGPMSEPAPGLQPAAAETDQGPAAEPETLTAPETQTASGIAAGVAVIRGALKTMPATPGVYRMLDRHGDALYVGKARNLRGRVQNYAHPAALSNRLRRMIAETAAMEIVSTHTEAEALLLE